MLFKYDYQINIIIIFNTEYKEKIRPLSRADFLSDKCNAVASNLHFSLYKHFQKKPVNRLIIYPLKVSTKRIINSIKTKIKFFVSLLFFLPVTKSKSNNAIEIANSIDLKINHIS